MSRNFQIKFFFLNMYLSLVRTLEIPNQLHIVAIESIGESKRGLREPASSESSTDNIRKQSNIFLLKLP